MKARFPPDMFKEDILPISPLLDMFFVPAVTQWLEDYRVNISPKTYRDYASNIRVLSPFFSKYKLGEIDWDHCKEYQKNRLKQGVGKISINHELDFLCFIRRYEGKEIEGYHRLRKAKRMPGQAVTREQYDRLLRLAKSNPDWMCAFLYIVLSVNTSVGPGEMFHIRLKDIQLEDEIPFVDCWGTKTEGRPRRLPLNRLAYEAIEMALIRAKKLGASKPEHFLFPLRRGPRGGYDPDRPMTTIKTAWSKLKRAAGLPTLRAYDMRHQHITTMLEMPGVSDQVVEENAGHIDSQTKKFYSHQRLKAKRDAVMRLCGDEPPAEPVNGNGNGNGHKKPSRSSQTEQKVKLADGLLEVLAGVITKMIAQKA